MSPDLPAPRNLLQDRHVDGVLPPVDPPGCFVTESAMYIWTTCVEIVQAIIANASKSPASIAIFDRTRHRVFRFSRVSASAPRANRGAIEMLCCTLPLHSAFWNILCFNRNDLLNPSS